MYLLNYIFLDPIWHFANFLKHPNWIIQLEESGMVQTAPFAKLAHKHDQINGLQAIEEFFVIQMFANQRKTEHPPKSRHDSSQRMMGMRQSRWNISAVHDFANTASVPSYAILAQYLHLHTGEVNCVTQVKTLLQGNVPVEPFSQIPFRHFGHVNLNMAFGQDLQI